MTSSLQPSPHGAEIVERALARAREAGATQADSVLVEADSSEARVRGDEIDFVKQARERCLGIRVLIAGPAGMRSAVTSTSDVSPDAIDRMAAETVALARATAEDLARYKVNWTLLNINICVHAFFS